MNAHATRFSVRHRVVVGFAALATAMLLSIVQPAASEQGEVSGTLVANGQEVVLPHVYVWAEKEGFYDPGDPTWKILFVEREVAQKDLGDPIWDAAWVEIGITKASGSGDQSELQVYTQSIKLSADSAGNISGGTYPQFEIEGLDSGRISGRIYHTETQEFFENKYSYDFTFSASLSDPNAPIGDLLPDGGGEPGSAFLKWADTVHSGDLALLKSIVPADMAEQIDAASEEEAKEQIEFMQLTTPKDVKILGGSSDGETALLQIEGTMEGEKIKAEVTMTRMGEFWIPTEVSM